MAKALENIRVLDFTRMYVGPFCTMLLKELGAEVIKAEFRGSGDAIRTIPPITEGGESYVFAILNRGKKSITLDVTSNEGLEIVAELVKKADVLVENFSPGVMDRLGLGYEKADKINPGLIYASMSGFGHTGPSHSQPSYDIVGQASGGFMSVTGQPGNPPTKAGPAIADFGSGLFGAISILAALHYRDSKGEGQQIDLSLQDCIWEITSLEYSPYYFLLGEVPSRIGNELINVVPYGTYPAKDGHVIIPIVTVGQWERFAKLIGREDLTQDPSPILTLAERVNHRDEINALVTNWVKERTVTEVMKEMDNANLPCYPVPTLDRVASDPQLLSRGMITEIEQLISGKLKVPGSVFKFSKTPGEATLPAPFLGQHNREVYSEILGYSEERINSLLAKGII